MVREAWRAPLSPEGAAAPAASSYGLKATALPLERALRAFGFRDAEEAKEAGRTSLKAARSAGQRTPSAADRELSFEEGLLAHLQL